MEIVAEPADRIKVPKAHNAEIEIVPSSSVLRLRLSGAFDLASVLRLVRGLIW